jgi:PAS domain S-box-containing protein
MVDETAVEAKQLEALVNDLMGIVALPAIWSGSSPAEIVRTVVDMLVGMLRLDFIYLRLKHSAVEPALAVVRCGNSHAVTGLPPEVMELLETCSGDQLQKQSRLFRNGFGGEDLSISALPLGIEAEIGILAAGSRRADFPSRTERLLLSVTANQVTVWLQGARLLSEQKRVVQELDEKAAQRTGELAAANSELRRQIAKEQSISVENRQLIRDLEDREQKIRRLIDSNIIGIVIWDLDGRLIDANDAFLHMVGYEREDLKTGLRWFDMTPPEWQEAHARYEAEELKATGMMQAREKEYFRKDGSRVPVLIGAACFEGQSDQGVAYIVDLSQQKRAEEALRRSQSYLAEAQRLTQTGSCAIDGASRETVYWSDEMFQLFGFDPRQGPPKWEQFLDRIHPEDRDKVKLANERTFHAKVNCDVEFRIVKPDGTIKHIHGIGHPVLGSSEQLAQVLGTMVDVTERKRAEEVLAQVRRLEADLAHTIRISAMGELTASLAHEIKQPIGAAVTNAQACLRLIDREKPDLPEAREAALEMIKDARRAADIIDRVRLLFQKGSSQLERLDVNQVIEEMVTMMRETATRQGVTVRTELVQGLPNVMADRVQLQQALMNLMLNAIEAMEGSGGELSIRSRLASDGQQLISVSDTGVGLPTENLDKIFNAFFTTKTRGTGLGLAITRSVIESHGGQIWATANSERGATFQFTLPGAEENAR